MDFTGLRPTALTSVAIKEALDRARAMNATVMDHVTTAKAERDGMLLDGDASQLAAAEKALAEARGDEERLEAIAGELSSRLLAMQKAETVNDVRASLATARDATDARTAWWNKNGKKLQTLMREAATLHIARTDAVEITKRKQISYAGSYDDASEVTAEIYAEIPPADDVDDVAWRVFEKVAETWGYLASTYLPDNATQKEIA